MKRKQSRLKKCPVCGAQSFEDIEVCYGCMHQFKEDHLTIAPETVPAETPLEQATVKIDLPSIQKDEGARHEKGLGENLISVDVSLPKEARAKHRASEEQDQAEQTIRAEYKLVVSLLPA